jgi:hypothetical protein
MPPAVIAFSSNTYFPPNRITFFTGNETLVEEHIPGLPGDVL